MTNVIIDISISLDGFITAANRTPQEPMGPGGERLHEWAFGSDERGRQVLAKGVGSTGAVIMVLVHMGISLDGFSTGPNVRIGNGIGDGGEQLHEWMMREGGRTGRGGEVLEDLFEGAGAVVVGRRMFDLGEEPWGDPPPFHNNPVFVVTHRPKAPVVKQGGTTYTFVTDGLDATLARAREAAGGRAVVVLGGAEVIRQCLKGGFLDELHLHLVHVLLGDGTRLFGDLDAASAAFERTRVIDAEGVTHLRFRLVQ